MWIETLFKQIMLLLLPFLFISTAGCNKCRRCDPLPNDVSQMPGEWEWVYTKRQFILEQGTGSLYNDTITPADVSKSVVMQIGTDGCLSFTVDNEEYHTCIKVTERRMEEQDLPFYECTETVLMTLDGKDLTSYLTVYVKGDDCGSLSTLVGTAIPFGGGSFITPPPTPFGLEVNAYRNHFVRR